jgi:soluble lytic murein transglycosylase-like protein
MHLGSVPDIDGVIRMHRRLMATVAALIAFALVPCLAQAASWGSVRDRIMTLREHGRTQEAYALALASSPSGAADRVDRDFVAGFLALRFMNSPAAALGHFKAMADGVTKLRASEQPEARSKAGYWLGATFDTAGRPAEARRLYQASATYRDTFYGMVSASKAQLTDTAAVVAVKAGSYPMPQIAWHDERISTELVFAVVKAESAFKPTAVSGAGAKGLMQLMDDTAKAVGKKAGVAIDLALVARNGHYNIAVGSKHLADLMQGYGNNVAMSAAAYNAGERRVTDWVSRFGDPRRTIAPIEWIELIPFKETREYVQKVSSNYLSYLALTAGRPS